MPSHHVALSPERYDQLQRLATEFTCSLPDAVGHLLDAAASVGVISRQLKGLSVERTDAGQVAVDLGGGRRLLPPDAAERYATHVLGTARLLSADAATRYAKARGPKILPDSGFGAVRRGAGIKLLDPEHHVEKSISPSVAAEFAKQLLDAAK